MINIRLGTLWVFLLTSLFALSQEYFKISGRVTLGEGVPAPFAHIYVKGKNFGGTTDIDGKFSFHISSKFARDRLIISHLGYKSLELPVVDALEGDYTEFVLDEKVIELKGITVYAPHQLLKNLRSASEDIISPPLNYKRSGLLTFTRKEDEVYTLVEQIAFNFYRRGEEENKYGYEPLAHRRTIDYSAFAFLPPNGATRRYEIDDLFGITVQSSFKELDTNLENLDVEITDLVDLDGEQHLILTETSTTGRRTNYYIKTADNKLTKVERVYTPAQIKTFVSGSPFDNNTHNRFRYQFIDSYYFKYDDEKLVLAKVTHDERSQYIDRLSGHVTKVYHDHWNIDFFDLLSLDEQPKKYADRLQLPVNLSYDSGYWEEIESKNGPTINVSVRDSFINGLKIKEEFDGVQGKTEWKSDLGKSSFSKKDQTTRSDVSDLTAFMRGLLTNKYVPDYPPVLSWEDIPALLEISNSSVIVDRFPRNILSNLYIRDCQVGIVAMWLIDSIRKSEGKRVRKAWYISPVPLLEDAQDRQKSESRSGQFIPTNSNEKLATAHKAFVEWWEKAEVLGKAKARRINPLASSSLNWIYR